MFYFDSNTTIATVYLLSAAHFWKAYIDRMLFGYAEGTHNCTDPEHGPRYVATAIFYRNKHGWLTSLCI